MRCAAGWWHSSLLELTCRQRSAQCPNRRPSNRISLPLSLHWPTTFARWCSLKACGWRRPRPWRPNGSSIALAPGCVWRTGGTRPPSRSICGAANSPRVSSGWGRLQKATVAPVCCWLAWRTPPPQLLHAWIGFPPIERPWPASSGLPTRPWRSGGSDTKRALPTKDRRVSAGVAHFGISLQMFLVEFEIRRLLGVHCSEGNRHRHAGKRGYPCPGKRHLGSERSQARHADRSTPGPAVAACRGLAARCAGASAPAGRTDTVGSPNSAHCRAPAR